MCITTVVLAACLALAPAIALSLDAPADVTDTPVLTNLLSPVGLEFSPDGRMFICERVVGALRVAEFDAEAQQWILQPTPFYVFDIPKDAGGQPDALRSAGLRDVAFDPDFALNGYVYAFYMKNEVAQNRVVRIQTSAADPHLADPASETLLMELPSNASGASGSHNGGAVEFGSDGFLYVSTGDGWNGGDNVQSLTTFTGKVFRIGKDGSIPEDNPFVDSAPGDLRAIYALGLRNPFSLTRDPTTGSLYINDVAGSDKGNVYLLRPAANYGHDGYAGIGIQTAAWANGGDPGGRVISGAVWHPLSGTWPVAYRGRYFVTMWGPNSGVHGHINFIDASDASVNAFASQVGRLDLGTGELLKPASPRFGPDGNLYYLNTTYATAEGAVHRIEYTGPPVSVPAAVTDRLFRVWAHPNPSNPTANISYTLPRGGTVQVTVHDAAGRHVDTLWHGRQGPGEHQLLFRAESYASGVYHCRVDFEGVVATQKVTVVQ